VQPTDGTAAPTGDPRGRSARGQRRRRALVEAAAELIAEQGFAAVSHRLVAQRAGLPLAATTYYFSSLDQLLEEALRHLAEQWLGHGRDVLAGLPSRLAGPEQVADAVLRIAWGPVDALNADALNADALLALGERYLEAGRHPQLRPLVASYNDQVDTLLMQVLARGGLPEDRRLARLVLAQVDGAVLRALAEGLDPAAAVVAALEALLRLLPVAQSHGRAAPVGVTVRAMPPRVDDPGGVGQPTRSGATRPPPHSKGVAMGIGDKISNKAEELAGKSKAGVGEATNDPNLKAEGQTDQASAKTKQAGENIKDALRDAGTAVKGDKV